MKALHRQIVTSAAYRMSSHSARPTIPTARIDPDNHAYWHFPAARMEAEVVRDSLLHLAGAARPDAVGGPDIDLAKGLTSRRRSLYFTHHGEARMPFLELFDAPDACDAYRRTTSVVPQQALALVNNELLLDLSQRAGRPALVRDGGRRRRRDRRDEAFITAAFEQILTRPPSPRERALSREFLASRPGSCLLGIRRDGTRRRSQARARRDLVHALFSHNDFITIH